MANPVFPQVLRLFIVVRDAEKASGTFEEHYGIGPWVYHDFSDEAVPEKSVRGTTCHYAMKLATCDALNVGLALIEPLDERSIFAEHLKAKGPGLHHILVTTRDGFEETLAFIEARGNSIAQKGRAATGVEFAHLDLTPDLGLIVEVFKAPPG